MKFSPVLALVLATASGFLSLGYEMLWARLCSYVSSGRSTAFGVMLAVYLLGLAGGSLLSIKVQARAITASLARRFLARLFLIAYGLSFLTAPLTAHAVVFVPWQWLLALLFVASAAMGVVLPLLCHLAVSADASAGRGTARIYLANILGAVLGSLGTSFVLMDHLPFGGVAAVLLGLALLAGLLLYRSARELGWGDYSLVACVLALVCFSGALHQDFYERLLHKKAYQSGQSFIYTKENKHGVINVGKDLNIYGGGVYDGRITIDPNAGTLLVRPLFLSAVHPKPASILMVGMSGGSWTQLLANHPQLERLTVIEINPGYLDTVRHFPVMRSLLTNPKVEIIIDDARRWLRRNPERRFDAIVMNTTYNWREHASTLLSREMLTLTSAHLNPEGIVLWNTTSSGRAIVTGMLVFKDTFMIGNACVGSNSRMVVDAERWRRVLSAYQVDGVPLFDSGKGPDENGLNWHLGILREKDNPRWSFLTRPEMIPIFQGFREITDDNLGDEYKSH